MADIYANLKPVDSSFLYCDEPEDNSANQLISYNPKDLDSNTIPATIINKINTFRRTKNAKSILELVLILFLVVMVALIAMSILFGTFTTQHNFTALLAISFPYACLFTFDFIFRKLLSRKAPADSNTKNWFYKLSLFFALVIFIVAIPEWSVISDFYQNPQDLLYRTIGLSNFFGIVLLCTVISAVLECYLNSTPKDENAATDEHIIVVMNKLAFIVDKNIENDPIFPLSSDFITCLKQLDAKQRLTAIYKLAVWFRGHPEERNANFIRNLETEILHIKGGFSVNNRPLPSFSAASSAISASINCTGAPATLTTQPYTQPLLEPESKEVITQIL